MRYRFSQFELDTEAYRLTRDGQPLRLRPKVFDVLRFLIERRDRIVTKQELIDALWEGDRVNDEVISWAISLARRAIGQKARDHDPIETLYRRGYRWHADVRQIEDVRAQTDGPEDAGAFANDPSRLPFVGRTKLMEALHQRLVQAKASRGGLCLLVGEPGIGKTRCMQELAATASAMGFSSWSGRAVQERWAPSLWPWAQVLRAAATESEARTRARALLAQMDAGADARAEREPGADDQPSYAPFALLDSIARFLFTAARRRPLLLLLDDLHWADAASIDLLSVIAPELRQHPLLVVTSQRNGLDGARSRRVSRLARHGQSFELPPLTIDDVQRYIHLVSRSSEEVTDLSTAVHSATAGNALFLQETVRALAAQHGMSRLPLLSVADVKPPQLARDVLLERLDALDAQTRGVIATASVLGERFDADLLKHVSGVCGEVVIGALDSASRAGFVRPEGLLHYRFCHALVRGLIYDSLPALVRTTTHRSAAKVIARTGSVAPRPGELAHHYYHSLALGEPETVAAAARAAAEAALRGAEFEDAATFCRWALDAQALDLAATPRDRGELLLLAARSARHAGSGTEARGVLAQLVELASRHGFTDLLVRTARVLRPGRTWSAFSDPFARTALEETLRIASEDSEDRISALSQLASIAPHALDMERSKELSGQAMMLARKQQKPELLAEALRAQLYALSGPDDIDAVLVAANEMLSIDGDEPSWISISAHSARYGAYIHRGDLAAANEALAALGLAARRQKRPEARWYHDRLLAQRRIVEDEVEGAERGFAEMQSIRLNHHAWMFRIPQALRAMERDGTPSAAASWDFAALVSRTSRLPAEAASLARIALSVGRHDVARSLFDHLSVDDFGRIRKDISYLNALVNLSMMAIALSDRPRAERLYELLAPYPHHNTPSTLMHYEGSVSHYLALLGELIGEPDRVRAHFEDALGMNEALGNRARLARTCYEYARFLTANALSRRRASSLKSQALRLAGRLELTALETQVRAL